MHVELLDFTSNPLERIGRYAGICYNSSMESDACTKRAIACKDRGHLSTLRFAYAVFHISGISRVCSHQLVRSKHLDFLQRSQRYCKELDAKFVLPETTETNMHYIEQHYRNSLSLYTDLIANGMKKEDARFVLPEATHTELIVTGNFQAWVDFIKLRADKHAQWEIRAVAKIINNLLAEQAPGIFNWMP